MVALTLTPESGGNANGVGYADFITEQLAAGVDPALTTLNAATAGFPEAALMPPILPDEGAAIEAALEALGNPPQIRAVRITDTSRLTKVSVSAPLLESLPRGVEKL